MTENPLHGSYEEALEDARKRHLAEVQDPDRAELFTPWAVVRDDTHGGWRTLDHTVRHDLPGLTVEAIVARTGEETTIEEAIAYAREKAAQYEQAYTVGRDLHDHEFKAAWVGGGGVFVEEFVAEANVLPSGEVERMPSVADLRAAEKGLL